ncbi:hypothetical protein F4820DRAFT_449067 [Hypoxylon rubiginosum]|uniref:Uncharacterized protein n=1 Tax=Hypoxylon rubiginosum TaxID=110542 RepID=A0ACB9YZG3_9PEZI|nr:hypothetical protein F4820DRAFT_449067 [Hypoxylon rubiginosum]
MSSFSFSKHGGHQPSGSWPLFLVLYVRASDAVSQCCLSPAAGHLKVTTLLSFRYVVPQSAQSYRTVEGDGQDDFLT